MIPILYESTETSFTSLGLGRLRDCVECIVTEERNGIYECDFQYPVSGVNYSLIKPGRIVAVEHDDTNDVQPFDIISSSKPINGVVSFHAVHISYRMSKMVASGSNINTLSAAFDMLTNSTPQGAFVFQSDLTNTDGYVAAANGVPKSVRQMLGGEEGSILDTFGGEFKFDKWNVNLLSNRGSMKDFTIRYGVDLADYNEEVDYSDSYSSVVPYWASNNVVIGSKVTAQGITYNGRDDCIALDCSDKFETQPTALQLETYAQDYLSSANSLLPKQTITVDFVRLTDSTEYSGFSNLYKCSLCDTIRVSFPMYGMEGQFKIVRTVYNVLLERFDEMELGSLQQSLAQALGLTS